MTKPTIDLQRGLDLWIDAAERYYDSQRGELEDQSGYGRHGEVKGGTTVGVAGPRDLGAVDFPAMNSDFIRTGYPTDYYPDEFSAFIFAAPEETDTHTGQQNVFNHGSAYHSGGAWSVHAFYNDNSDCVSARVYDESTDSTVEVRVNDHPYWRPAILEYVANEYVALHTPEGTDAAAIDFTPDYSGTPTVDIGARSDYSGHGYVGKFAAAAAWSRTLNRGEREYLFSMTGVRRSRI